MSWPGHVCQVDFVAVENGITGHGPKLNHCDRNEAVSEMRRLGYSLSKIADRMHVTQRSVERMIANQRLAAASPTPGRIPVQVGTYSLKTSQMGAEPDNTRSK